jgi:hypothetical protein
VTGSDREETIMLEPSMQGSAKFAIIDAACRLGCARGLADDALLDFCSEELAMRYVTEPAGLLRRQVRAALRRLGTAVPPPA